MTVAGARKGIRSAWGCVCAGTKVYNSKCEQINIENLSKADGIIGFKNNSANVEPISYMQGEAYKECVRIKTNYGDLECSIDHPVYSRLYINHRNGAKRWKEYYYKFLPAKDVKHYSVYSAICLCDKLDI